MDEAQRYYETAVQMDPGNAGVPAGPWIFMEDAGEHYRPNGYGHGPPAPVGDDIAAKPVRRLRLHDTACLAAADISSAAEHG